MTPETIIFDFDGVLANSFEQVYALNKMAMAGVGARLSRNQYRDFFMNNVHAAFKEFLKDGVSYLNFVQIRNNNFKKYYSAVKLFPGIPKVIKKLEEKSFLSIVSSGEKGEIVRLLKKANICDYFHAIYASTEYSKEEGINLVLKTLAINPHEAVMISDTCGDLNLAKNLGLKTIGVSWGFHSAKKLLSTKPDFLANNLIELRLCFQ